MPDLSTDALRADIAARFPVPATAGTPWLIGAEAEVIPVDAVTRAPVPLDGGAASTFGVLRRLGRSRGWKEQRSFKACVPEFHLPNGGRITFEPGGQIELSAAPCTSASDLLRALRDTLGAIRDEAAGVGIELLAVGLDPLNPIEAVVPQLDAERYRRMLAYFNGIGPSGARMMRQTAAFQVCVDGGERPLLAWRVLNAMAPHLSAMFANSPESLGVRGDVPSVRRGIWQTLDPCRTGMMPCTTDPVSEYLDFALAAPAFLLATVGDDAPPFGEAFSRGQATTEDWCTHVTTLFPEVRPRGYYEVRSIDALPEVWHAAPLALLTGILYHGQSLDAAAELLGPPDSALLERAATSALGDPALADASRELVAIALAGCDSLGDDWLTPDDRARAEDFFARFTLQGKAPGD
jgi:glutamate--cysteine ligase